MTDTALKDQRSSPVEPHEYEFEIWQGGIAVVIGGGTDLAAVRRELGHYLMVYTQDGPCEVRGKDLKELLPPEMLGTPLSRQSA